MTTQSGTQFSYNPAEEGVSADTGFDVLPPGWYAMQMIESGIEANRAGDGTYFSARFEVMHPEFAKGRIIFNNYNISTTDQSDGKQQSIKIGKSQLAGLMLAMGVPYIQQATSELHAKPFFAKLKVKKSEQYGDQNEIQAYKSTSESVSFAEKGAATAAGAGHAPPPPAANTAPPPPAAATTPPPPVPAAAPAPAAAPVTSAPPAQPWDKTTPAATPAAATAPAAAEITPPWLQKK